MVGALRAYMQCFGGIAVVEMTTPVGYTSGGCVNAGRFYAAGDMKQGSKVLAMCTLYYAGGEA